jgi:hypothetical protein
MSVQAFVAAGSLTPQYDWYVPNSTGYFCSCASHLLGDKDTV